MKRILLVIDSLRIGGAERVTLTLAKQFTAMGHKVDLITVDAEIRLNIPEEVRHFTIDFNRSFCDYTRYSRKLHQMIYKLTEENKAEYDLILVHLQKSVRLMRTFSHPRIYFCVHTIVSRSSLSGRTGFRKVLKKKRLQRIYNGLNIITVSQGIADDLIANVGIKPKSIQCIYNPVDSKELEQKAYEHIGVEIGTPYIIHVGRLTASKRHDLLLEAFKVSGIDAKLIIVGDGKEAASIKAHISALNLENKVIMTGFMDNPYPLIKNARMLVLTSDYEGFAIVLVEALMLGTIVVSSDCPSGPSEILSDDLQEYLVEPDNVDVLAQKIMTVFNKGYTIPKSVLARFESGHIAKQYLALE